MADEIRKTPSEAEVRAYQLGKTNIDPFTGLTKAESRKRHTEALEAQDEAIRERGLRHKAKEVEVIPQNLANEETETNPMLKSPLDDLLSQKREALDAQAEEIAKTKNIELPKFHTKPDVANFILLNG